MNFESQLDFLTRYYQKCNLQLLTLDPWGPLDKRIDIRFRESLGRDSEYYSELQNLSMNAAPRTIYRMKDQYLCSYMFLNYVDDAHPVFLSIGPYLSQPMGQEQIVVHAEKLGITPQQLGNYFMDYRMSKYLEGPGKIKELGAFLKEKGINDVLAVTGSGMVRQLEFYNPHQLKRC